MSNLIVGVIVGSIREGSINQSLAKVFEDRVPEGVEVKHIDISKLPLYHQGLEVNFPSEVKEFKDVVRNVDAILFITPEHNRSLTTLLKNAIDWGSRPYGDSVWTAKTVAIAGATGGLIATYGAQGHLRDMLVFLGSHTMSQPQFYFSTAGKMDDAGNITDDQTLSTIDSYWASFVEWANIFKK